MEWTGRVRGDDTWQVGGRSLPLRNAQIRMPKGSSSGPRVWPTLSTNSKKEENTTSAALASAREGTK